MSRATQISREESLEKWKGIIEDCNNSGLTQKQYCKLHGLSHNTFYYWKGILREKGFETYTLDTDTRKHYMRIAKELEYPERVISDIKKAKNKFECEQILRNARKGDYDK